MGMALKLTIVAQSTADGRSTALAKLLRKAAKDCRVTSGEWSISLIDDATMTQLHGRTMNLHTTTDVLTFDLGQAVRGVETRRHIELDTVICVDEANRRAAEMGHPVEHEILLYAVHSLLHVLGYDDTTPAKFKAMHRREDEILTTLGVGPVFQKPRIPARKRVRS
jgi:probable rRNA maturation factor